MFKKKQTDPEIDYDNEFKVVIASNSSNKDQLKVHQSQNPLKSLESFSRSSESLSLSVTPLESKKQAKIKRKNKSRSATRSCNKEESKLSHVDESADYGVSRDQGESFMSKIMRNVNKESKNIIGDCEEERLRLMNIRLESKLSRMCQENEEYLRERIQTKIELETVKQNLSDTKSINDILEEELDLINRGRDNDIRKVCELENSLHLKEADIQSKLIDFEQISNEMYEYQENLNQTNEKMRLVVEDLDRQNFVVSNLKKKISEYHSQLELTKLYKENSEYQAEQLQLELTAMKKARNWFEDQLKNVEETKDKLQVEVHRITNCLLESKHENENLRQKNKSFELKLVKFQNVKLNETTALLFELEQLQKEIMISDEEKRDLEDQYSQIMKKYNERIRDLEHEQEKNRILNQMTEDLNVELEEIRSQYVKAQNNINELEAEGTELRKKLDVLENTLQLKIDNLKQSEEEKAELENNLKELNANSSEKDLIIRNLKEELGNLKMSFDRIYAERDQACVGIEKLREEIDQVVNQYEITRQDLSNKEQVLKLVEELNDDLREKLTKETEEVSLRDKTIVILKSEKNQLLESREQFQQNNLQILQELDMLRNNFNLANITIAGMEEELTEMKSENTELNKLILDSKNEVEKFKTDLMKAQEKVESLSHVQGMYSKLFEDHKRLEEGYNELYGQHKTLSEEYKQVTGDLKAKLEEREEELERVVAMKEEIVFATQKDLSMADQSRKELKNELETIKFNHTVELATKEEQFREQLDKSSKDFSEMCQEKIRCERAIESLQGHITLIVEEYNKKLNECKAKMLRLERQSTEYAEHENLSRSLLEELEKKKGEIEAILEIWKKMKHHTEIVENASARRDAQFSHFINNHEESLLKKDEEIKKLKETLNNQNDKLKSEENIKNNFMCQLEERVSVIDQLRKKIDNHERNKIEMQLNLSSLNSDLETVYRENQLFKESQKQLAIEIENKTLENRKLISKNQTLLESNDQAILSREAEKKVANALQQEFDIKCDEIKNSDTMHQDLMKGSQNAIEEMTNVIKNVTEQNDSLIRKVELSKQQDLFMTAILNQLRSEIKKIIFQQEIQRSENKSINLSPEQLDQLKKLLDETKEPTISFRPQTRISKCIEDLRTQIDSMQIEISKQIDEQLQSQSLEIEN